MTSAIAPTEATESAATGVASEEAIPAQAGAADTGAQTGAEAEARAGAETGAETDAQAEAEAGAEVHAGSGVGTARVPDEANIWIPGGSAVADEAPNITSGAPAAALADDAADDATDDPADDTAEVSDLVAEDARAFGVYARTGGWAFALMVARSVRPGGQAVGETPKISARRFSELAGCSAERVMRYYKAWDSAADDGLVPQFEALTPGQDVELPDSDAWLAYYSSRSSAVSPRGHAITAAAEAEGIRPTKALEVAENPTALRAAILADPGTAEAARKALMDRLEEDPALRTELVRDIVRADDLKKAVAAEAKAGDRVEYVRQIAENGQIKTPAGQKIEAPRALREEAERHLSLIDELDDDEEAGEWAREAYDSVRELVTKAVESDPELRVKERRAKFYNSLQKATKVFEELTLDDAEDDVYEDDMLKRLEDLQQAIASCISAIQAKVQ